MRRVYVRTVLVLFFACSNLYGQRNSYIELGFADELALDQPRISVELLDQNTGQPIGPDLAATFLLDTGANSILATDDSVFELNRGGYQTEGDFFEQGVAGFTRFDVSAEYDIRFTGSDFNTHQIENGRILSSETVSFCPAPGLCSFFGIVGMPAMIDRVTTLDFTTIGGEFGADIFEDIFSLDFMSTTFSSEIPATSKRRYTVPVTPSDFRPETDGPVPSWADLPFMKLESVHEGISQTGDFILDTGAQLSIISSHLAFSLGLDKNGNGILLDEAVGTQAIGGIGGTIDAPLMIIDELRVPTEEGVDLIFNQSTVAVVDIDPTIDGIFGMNYLTSGWSGAAFGVGDDLSDLEDLLNDAGLQDLLEELGGIGLGGLVGSPYPFFEKVHFDFREHRQSNGRIYFDLSDDVPGVVDPSRPYGDLDGDQDIDFEDLEIWVHDVKQTHFGDANLDGQFDSQDLVSVFQAAEYEDQIIGNSKWEEGDWNGDGEFDSRDLVLAFQDGGYSESGIASVPEPSSSLAVILALSISTLIIRQKSSPGCQLK